MLQIIIAGFWHNIANDARN